MKIDFLYKKYQDFLIVLATISFVMALFGWTLALYPKGENGIDLFLEALIRSILFFVGEGVNETYTKGGYLLKVAEIFSLICSFGAVLWGFFLLSFTDFIRRKISRLEDHLVVIGFGETSKSLIFSEIKKWYENVGI